jgi:hypothetical protein
MSTAGAGGSPGHRDTGEPLAGGSTRRASIRGVLGRCLEWGRVSRDRGGEEGTRRCRLGKFWLGLRERTGGYITGRLGRLMLGTQCFVSA